MNKINNKPYIGITSQNPIIRWQGGRHYKTCPHIYRAIQKYGWDNFEHIIFQDNLTYEEANNIERLLIQLFQTNDYNLGYNIKIGGLGGKHSESTKEKIRKKAIGRKYSDERKAQISKQTQGKNNPRAKKVKCLNTNQIFDTAKEAAIWCDRDNSSLSKCAKGKTNYCGFDKITGEKLKWAYLT